MPSANIPVLESVLDDPSHQDDINHTQFKVQTHRYQNSKIAIQWMICSTLCSIMASSVDSELGECCP